LQLPQNGAQNQNNTGVPASEAPSIWPPPTNGAVNSRIGGVGVGSPGSVWLGSAGIVDGSLVPVPVVVVAVALASPGSAGTAGAGVGDAVPAGTAVSSLAPHAATSNTPLIMPGISSLRLSAAETRREVTSPRLAALAAPFTGRRQGFVPAFPWKFTRILGRR
jgi:hypothetical protein